MRRAAALLCAGLVAACGSAGSSGDGEAGSGLREVHFTTSDGVSLDGHLAGSGSRWVILSHMYPTDQTSWFGFARRLGSAGLSALAYDFRGYGRSGGTKDIPALDRDVLAAVDYARSHGATSITLVGASMGGTASLRAATELPAGAPLQLVVTMSAPLAFMGLDATGLGPRLPAPLLCLASTGDRDGALLDDAHQLCGTASQPRTTAPSSSTTPTRRHVLLSTRWSPR